MIPSAVSMAAFTFVVAGAAHYGGPDGVLSLLRQRGYSIVQL